MGFDFNGDGHDEDPADTSSGKTQHINDEAAVVCPADGCEFTDAKRAVAPHIRMCSDDAHGPKYEVPDHLDVDSAEPAGTEEVVMKYPNEQDVGDEIRYCPYCRSLFTGRNIMNHLGAKAGRDNHPKSPTEKFKIEDFAIVETDEYGNITTVIKNRKGDPSILIDG